MGDNIFADSFLDALGRWQRGWRRDPALREPLGAALLSEVAKLPSHVRGHDGSPLYRKRDLYRREDQGELVPLFLQGSLDEGSPTSWSTSLKFAERFGPVFDDLSPNTAAGAIFLHVPAAEVVLNIPRLWADPEFVTAAEDYRRRDGAEAKAIFHYRDERDQFEVILRAPLRADEIHRLGRPTTYEGLYAAIGATTDEAKSAVDGLLDAAGINPFEARYLFDEATRRIVPRVIARQRARLDAWFVERTPSRPPGRRGRLADAFELGRSSAAPYARFLGWRRLRGRGGLTEGRWSDGTVAYLGGRGRIWLW